MELSKEHIRNEVLSFRSQLKEESVANAENSLRLVKRDKIGVIEFDCVGEKVNKLSTPNMLRLAELLMEVESDSQLQALVIISRKERIFIAGADIAEIEMLTTGGPDTVDSLMKLQSVFTYLELLPIPTVAAIHGACLGGGMELALSCDFRMVTDAPETRIGLPEVQLGVIPGWGGTQRLPALIGLESSLDLILTGKHIDGKRAFRKGIAERLVPKEMLEDKAMLWAEELGVKRLKKQSKTPGLRERILRNVPGGKKLIFDQARKKLLEKTKGNYPAPLKAVDVIEKTFGGSQITEGLKVEAKAFAELVKTPQCANLIKLFYLTEKIKKDKGTESGVRAKPVTSAGVLGAGVMGGGIAQLFAAKKVRVRMKDIHWDAVAKGYQAAFKIFQKRVKRRRMKQNELDNAMSLISGTTSFHGFKNLDVVVEAVVEDLEIKKKVFKELDTKVGPNTILATNTSTLPVTALAEACSDPKRVVGMHFFNPVDKMPLVEVIRGKETSDQAVATIFQFSKALGKTPVVVNDGPGFVVNRILGPYLNEAIHLMMEGVKVEDLDRVLEKFGMPMGPCTLLDEVGLDVAVKAAKVLFGAFGKRMEPPSLMNKIKEEGRFGKKNGKGIYLYENGKRKGVDESAFAGLDIPSRSKELTDEVIQKRMIYLMVNEAARVLDEKLVREESDIDVAMIFGTGFAPFRGGLLRYADSVGTDKIAGDLDVFARSFGPRFEPAAYLQKLAVDGKKFYDQ